MQSDKNQFLLVTADERVLASTWRLARYEPSDQQYRQYDEAINAGTVIRESSNTGDDPDWIRLIQYLDPEDGTSRYVIDTQQPDGGEWIDYLGRRVAGARYEHAVRSQAEVGYRYTNSDVLELY